MTVKTYTALVKNGKATFMIHGLKAELHDINAFYSGDDKYLPYNATGTIKVLAKQDKNETPDKEVHKSVKTGMERYETGNPILDC